MEAAALEIMQSRKRARDGGAAAGEALVGALDATAPERYYLPSDAMVALSV